MPEMLDWKQQGGEYVYFFDGDDLLAPGALEKAYVQCERFHLDVLFFSFCNFCDTVELEQKYSKMFCCAKRTSRYEDVLLGTDMFVQFCENKEYYVTVWLQLVSRKFLNDYHIRFYDGIIYEDKLYTFLVLMNARRAFCINEVLCYKRIRENSIVTGRQGAEYVKGHLVTVIEQLKFLRSLPITHPQLNRCIEKQICVSCEKARRMFVKIDLVEQETFLKRCTDFERTFFETNILRQ